MKQIKRNTAVLLLVAMLMPILGSCGSGTTTEMETENNALAETENTTPAETEPQRLYADDIGDDVKFDGQEIKIMTWLESGCYAEEQIGEVVNDAKFDRDLSVESRLNVDVVHIGETYAWSTRELYLGKIRNSVMANDGAYDIASGQYAVIPGLITDGVFLNMNTLNYLDFSKPYWAQQLVEETSIDGKLFLATGDITPMTIEQVWCIYYNETMRKNLGLDDIYDIVMDGKWTKDVMNTMLTGLWQDLDGDQKKSNGDAYGLVIDTANTTFPFINAFNLKVTTMNEDGYPELTINSEQALNAFEFMHNWCHVNPDVIFGGEGGSLAQPGNAFEEGRTLFIVKDFGSSKGYTEHMDEFRIAPMPKWDESQKNYQTWLGEGNSLFGIVTTTANKDATAATLEMMASESYRLVTPAIFEVNMKTRYSADSEMAQMFDLIREGVVFNFGLAYGFIMNQANVFWKYCLNQSTKVFTSTWAAHGDSYKNAIDTFYKKVRALEQ